MNKIFILSIWFFFFGSFIGVDIGGHIYLGNIAQIGSIFFGALIIHINKYKIRKTILITLIASIGTMLTSILWIIVAYDANVKFSHLLFFSICFSQLLIFNTIIKNNGNKDKYQKIVRDNLLPISATLIVFGFTDILIIHDVVKLQFADKSHASVALGIVGLICIRSMKGSKAYIIAISLVLLNFATISKLSIIFAAATFLAICVRVIGTILSSRAINTRPVKRSPFFLIFTLIIGFLVIGYITKLYIADENNISVFDRLADSDNGEQSIQTQAHLELIRLATEIKFHDPMIFIFGAAPSGFSEVAAKSGIDLTRIGQLDPGAFESIFDGTAPIHSAHLSMLVEFSLIIGAIYLWLWLKAFFMAIVALDLSMIIIIVATFSATTFYSTNHLAFFWSFLFWMSVEVSDYKYKTRFIKRKGILISHSWNKWKTNVLHHI